MKDNYITAVLEKLRAGDDPEQVLRGLKTTLERRGHGRLYQPVLRGVYRVFNADSSTTTVVTVTSKIAYEKQQAAITAALETLGAADTPKIVEDTTIVGGFIAEANDSRLDKSYKSKLVSLYRNLTK